MYEAMREKHNMRLYLDDNYNHFDNKGSVTFGHLDVAELLRQRIITKEYWQQAEKFTIVRNPYSRFISLWDDFRRTSRIDPNTKPTQFAKALLHMPCKPGLYNAYGFSQCASQIKWIVPGVKIYRYEEPELLPVKRAVTNKGSHDEWTKYYDTELVRLVTDLYYDGLVTLNYDVWT
jgi:hypothetical protein